LGSAAALADPSSRLEVLPPNRIAVRKPSPPAPRRLLMAEMIERIGGV